METNQEDAFKKICILADNFESNLQAYISSQYSETKTRLDFIDKRFIALMWNIYHTLQKTPHIKK